MGERWIERRKKEIKKVFLVDRGQEEIDVPCRATYLYGRRRFLLKYPDDQASESTDRYLDRGN